MKPVKYKHFKGGIYTYICDATLEWCQNDQNSHVIIYKGEDGKKWVRPRNEFFGYTKSGERRFTKIEEDIKAGLEAAKDYPQGRKLSCGHTVYYAEQVMIASRGTSCVDCYDRMSD